MSERLKSFGDALHLRIRNNPSSGAGDELVGEASFRNSKPSTVGGSRRLEPQTYRYSNRTLLGVSRPGSARYSRDNKQSIGCSGWPPLYFVPTRARHLWRLLNHKITKLKTSRWRVYAAYSYKEHIWRTFLSSLARWDSPLNFVFQTPELIRII